MKNENELKEVYTQLKDYFIRLNKLAEKNIGELITEKEEINKLIDPLTSKENKGPTHPAKALIAAVTTFLENKQKITSDYSIQKAIIALFFGKDQQVPLKAELRNEYSNLKGKKLFEKKIELINNKIAKSKDPRDPKDYVKCINLYAFKMLDEIVCLNRYTKINNIIKNAEKPPAEVSEIVTKVLKQVISDEGYTADASPTFLKLYTIREWEKVENKLKKKFSIVHQKTRIINSEANYKASIVITPPTTNKKIEEGKKTSITPSEEINLAQALAEKEDEITDLRSYLESALERRTSLERQVEELTDLTADLSLKGVLITLRESNIKEVSNLNEKNNQLKSQLTAIEKERDAEKQEKEKLESKVNELEQTIDEITPQPEQTNEAIQKLKEEKLTTETKLREKNEAVEALNFKVISTEKERDKAQQGKKEVESELLVKTREVETLTHEAISTKKALEAEKQKIEDIKRRLQETEEKETIEKDLRKKFKRKLDQLNPIEIQFKQAQEKTVNDANQIQALQAQVAKVKPLELQLQQTKQENKNANYETKNLENKLAKTNQLKQEAEAKVQELQQQKESAESKAGKLLQKIEALKSELQHINAQAEKFKQDKETTEKKYEESKLSFNQLLFQLQEEKKNVRIAEEQKDEADIKLSEADKQVNALENKQIEQLKDYEQTIDELQKKLSDAEQDAEEMKKLIANNEYEERLTDRTTKNVSSMSVIYPNSTSSSPSTMSSYTKKPGGTNMKNTEPKQVISSSSSLESIYNYDENQKNFYRKNGSTSSDFSTKSGEKNTSSSNLESDGDIEKEIQAARTNKNKKITRILASLTQEKVTDNLDEIAKAAFALKTKYTQIPDLKPEVTKLLNFSQLESLKAQFKTQLEAIPVSELDRLQTADAMEELLHIEHNSWTLEASAKKIGTDSAETQQAAINKILDVFENKAKQVIESNPERITALNLDKNSLTEAVLNEPANRSLVNTIIRELMTLIAAGKEEGINPAIIEAIIQVKGEDGEEIQSLFEKALLKLETRQKKQEAINKRFADISPSKLKETLISIAVPKLIAELENKSYLPTKARLTQLTHQVGELADTQLPAAKEALGQLWIEDVQVKAGDISAKNETELLQALTQIPLQTTATTPLSTLSAQSEEMAKKMAVEEITSYNAKTPEDLQEYYQATLDFIKNLDSTLQYAMNHKTSRDLLTFMQEQKEEIKLLLANMDNGTLLAKKQQLIQIQTDPSLSIQKTEKAAYECVIQRINEIVNNEGRLKNYGRLFEVMENSLEKIITENNKSSDNTIVNTSSPAKFFKVIEKTENLETERQLLTEQASKQAQGIASVSNTGSTHKKVTFTTGNILLEAASFTTTHLIGKASQHTFTYEAVKTDGLVRFSMGDVDGDTSRQSGWFRKSGIDKYADHAEIMRHTTQSLLECAQGTGQNTKGLAAGKGVGFLILNTNDKHWLERLAYIQAYQQLSPRHTLPFIQLEGKYTNQVLEEKKFQAKLEALVQLKRDELKKEGPNPLSEIFNTQTNLRNRRQG